MTLSKTPGAPGKRSIEPEGQTRSGGSERTGVLGREVFAAF